MLFVAQVGIHHKPFLKAAKETSDLFSAKQLDVIVSTDLTSSFCVLSGICGGMISVLTSGGLTFGTHQTPSSSLSIVSFFIGYFSVSKPVFVFGIILLNELNQTPIHHIFSSFSSFFNFTTIGSFFLSHMVITCFLALVGPSNDGFNTSFSNDSLRLLCTKSSQP